MPDPTRAPLPLYEIDAELEALEVALLDAGGEITDDVEAEYHDLLDMRAEKVAGYVAMIRRLELSAEAYDAEVKRLTANRNAMRNTAQRLKDRLCEAMCRRGEDEHETPLGRVRVQRASTRPVVVLVEVDALPERFRRISVSADKRALTDALKDGDEEALRCAELAEPSPYLRIY